MKHIWEWYGIAVAFLVGLLVVLLVACKVCAGLGADPLSRMLNGPTVGVLLAAIGLLAVVCVILSDKRPWEPDLKLAGKVLLLGGAVGLLFIGCTLWIFWHSGRGTNAAQTIVLGVQTLVLAVTAGFVVWYAWEAKRAADAGEEQVEAMLTGKTAVFVVDPIKTVGEYTQKCGELERLVRSDDTPITDDWLMLKITNEGDMNAINVRACARWTCPRGHESARAGEYDGMRRECELDQFDGNEYGTWWAWRLRPGKSRFLYLKPPRKRRP